MINVQLRTATYAIENQDQIQYATDYQVPLNHALLRNHSGPSMCSVCFKSWVTDLITM